MSDLRKAEAQFDEHDHCIKEGWAAYQEWKPMRRFRLRCWLGRHAWPWRVPHPRNGYSPSNYDRCCRCHAAIHWFVVGQHHYGSYSREVAEAYGLRGNGE